MTTIKDRLNKKANLLTDLANSTALMTSATGQALTHPGVSYDIVKQVISSLNSDNPKEKLLAKEALKSFVTTAAKGAVIPAATVAGTVAATKGLDALRKKGSAPVKHAIRSAAKFDLLTDLANSTALMTSATGQALAHPGKTYEVVKNMMSLLKSNKPKEKLFAHEALKAFTLMAAKGSVIPAATISGTVATTKGLDSLFNKKGSVKTAAKSMLSLLKLKNPKATKRVVIPAATVVGTGGAIDNLKSLFNKNKNSDLNLNKTGSVKTAANPFAMLGKLVNRGIAKIAPESAIGKAFNPVLQKSNISDTALIDLFKNKYKGIKGQNELQKLLGKNVINPNQLQQARVAELIQNLSAMKNPNTKKYLATAEKLRELMGRKIAFNAEQLQKFINSSAYNKYLNAQNAISKNPNRVKQIINDQLKNYRKLYQSDAGKANVKILQDALAKQNEYNNLVGSTIGAGGAFGTGYALNNRNP